MIRSFFQNSYIAGCPKCDNRQNPGDASMRMFGGARPFEYVRDAAPDDPLGTTLRRASEAIRAEVEWIEEHVL